MQIDNSFFEDEVRSGFFVPGMVKRGWAAQLEVLAEVDRICRKHHIQYFAEWGTLLGAVRHKGFIPWDDDMDICMKRVDYNRFLEIAPTEFAEGFSIGNVYTDLNYDTQLTRILNAREIHLDDEFLNKYHQFPYGAGLDLFPLDYISRDEESNNLQMQLLELAATYSHLYAPGVIDWGEGEPYLLQLQEFCGVTFDRAKPIQQQLLILIDRLSALFREDESDYLTSMALWKKTQTYKLPKEYYDEAVYLPFECMMVPVPKAYDAILQYKYGDYMRLVKNGSSHDYPFFAKQEKMLYELAGIRYRSYQCPEEINEGRIPRKKEERVVVFLVTHLSRWNAIRDVYEEECKKENTKVIVLPIPYFHRGFVGNQLDFCFEKQQFDTIIQTEDYELISLEQLHPDVIYIQDICDEYNKTMSIHPEYNSSKLWNMTEQLIYIPWFHVDDFIEAEERSYANMENYCMMPGMVYADQVWLPSDQMKNVYVQRLSEWAGENTRNLWQTKISVVQKRKAEECNTRDIIPNEWLDKLQKEDGSLKKILVYGNSANALAEGQQAFIEKLERVFSDFEKNKDSIAIIWNLDEYTEAFLELVDESIKEVYQQIINQFQSDARGIIHYEKNAILTQEKLVNLADAYYGDAGRLAHLFEQAKKPVMIQNLSV